MNLLFIDDEPLTIKMLKKQIPWQDIPIDQVYTAYDTQFARQIIKTFPIHIVLCDIEMPGESGIAFLHWLKESKLSGIVTLLLTCHDDFSYAKEGISLGVMDYILKPVAFDELTEILKKAVEEYHSRYNDQRQIQAGQLWEKHKNSIVKAFWKDFFSDTTQEYENTIDGLGFHEDSTYLLTIFKQKDHFKTLGSQDILIFLEQQMQPLFSYVHMGYTLFSPEDTYFYVVAWCDKMPDREALQYVFAQFQAMVMSLHINQIHLCGCLNGFSTLADLSRNAEAFTRFLEKHEAPVGMFIVDSDAGFTQQLECMVNSHLYEDIADYVRRHLSGEINRQDIADHVHLNADYLTRIFKKKMGITLMEYIRLERMNYARYLLRNTELTISEIALATGFNTPSHFSSAFRRQFECTPADYRNQR